MRLLTFFLVLINWHLSSGISYSQQVNGQSLTFPQGKTTWSDTIHKKLLTKEMAKKGVQPVSLAIRYKLVKKAEEGSLYDIEITNLSPATKVKFKVLTNHGQDSFTVKLDPRQTRVIEKLYWKGKPGTSKRGTDSYNENLDFPFDEMLNDRY